MRKTVCFCLFAAVLYADSGFLIRAGSFDADRMVEKVKTAPMEIGAVEKMVEDAAKSSGVDVALALSIAKVESNFNPLAVSSSNALGVMQLKMDTAVKDVFATIYQSSVLPSEEILFDPRENAKLGVAYLSLIQKKYLKEIEDAKKLEYCTIAAYNAGAGTVLRTFHDDKTEAAKIINSLSSEDVLRCLIYGMPSEQGRRYVLKVLEAKKSYQKNPE